MIVVSNTSPIINLAAVGQLDLLQRLYGRIVIPKAVYDEITCMGIREVGAIEVQTLEWVETVQVTARALATSLQMEMDKGEAEAIALTTELKADLLLLDERKGRVSALHLGLKFIGLLGVLVEAKQKGFVQDVKPVLDDLIAKAGFWVTKKLYDHVLETAGE